MRLLLRDYMLSLKEEGELDVLIGNLLFARGILPIAKTQKGVRQYGVDVVAKGKDTDGIEKLFIVTVKRGNITRNLWNGGAQSVKPSLDEILDVYLETLSPSLQKLPYKIILATNGELKQEVRINWHGYIRKESKQGKIEFEFWGNNDLADGVETHLMNEYIFKDSSKQLLQKALALIDLNEYDGRHFYQLIEEILLEKKVKNQKEAIKRLRLLNLCQGLIFKWGVDGDNIKNAYLCSERLLIRVSDFIRENNYFKFKNISKEFISILNKRMEIGKIYLEKIKPICSVENALASYSKGVDIEYALITFEQIGIIAQIGLESKFINDHIIVDEELKKRYFKFTCECIETLKNLIQNNHSSTFVIYDEHLIDINHALLLFYSTENFGAGKFYLEKLTQKIASTFKAKQLFPLFRRDYDKLLDIYLGKEKLETTSSHLLIILAEWSLVFDCLQNYQLIRIIIKKFFPGINLQIWFPGKDTEDTYYKRNAIKESGNVMYGIDLPEDYTKHIQRIQEEIEKFGIEKDFDLAFKFSIVALLSARHFRNLPFPIFWRIPFAKI